MYYNFELVMAGAILLTAMLVGGIALRIKRSRDIDETDVSASKSTSVKNTWPDNPDDTCRENTDSCHKTSFLDSFIVTPAARATNVSSYPKDIAASVFMLQGAIIMPSDLCVPLEIADAMFDGSEYVVASFCT